MEPTLVIASAHHLGMFVEPMQSLTVAGVERELEFRTSASQAILDRRQEMIDPLPSRRGNGERRADSHEARRASRALTNAP